MPLPVTISGRVIHQPGPWGSKRPLRNVGEVEIFLQNNTQSIPFGKATTNQGGWFNITANPQSFPATSMFIQVVDPCKVIMHSLQILRPPKQNASVFSPDDIGDITVPWEPADAQLADVNIFFLKDTQTLARRLCDILKSPYYPIHITLFRESVTGTGQDYTPAQRLLIPLKSPRSGFVKHLVEDIQDEVVSTKSNKTSDVIVEVLERFSRVTIKVLEESSLLNQLLAAIQRALGTSSYSENLMVDAAHDMAAACVILFLAGLIQKDKVQPTIMFPSASFGCSGNVKQQFSKILIDVNKK